jgi:hypothetical protein
MPSSAVGVTFEQSLPGLHFGEIRRFKSSVPIDSSVSKDDSESTQRVDWEPMTMSDRIAKFPKGVFCLLFKLRVPLRNVSVSSPFTWP